MKYDFWNYWADSKPVQTWASMVKEKDYPLNQVHQQRMLFSNYDTGTLTAIKLGNGQSVVLSIKKSLITQASRINTLLSGSCKGTCCKFSIQHVEGVAIFFNSFQLTDDVAKERLFFYLLIYEPF